MQVVVSGKFAVCAVSGRLWLIHRPTGCAFGRDYKLPNGETAGAVVHRLMRRRALGSRERSAVELFCLGKCSL